MRGMLSYDINDQKLIRVPALDQGFLIFTRVLIKKSP